MADKKRIARIGNNSSVQGTSKIQRNDGLAPAECNVVFGILESMNKSEIMSYKELQEFKSRPNCNSRTSSSEKNSSKRNSKPIATKQKKIFPEKSFPLMAKCQKSMKYLKKNRCIPKPRAHVGFTPKPPQKPTVNLKLIDIHKNVSVKNDKSFEKKNARNMKHPPKLPKASKISPCLDNSCETESTNEAPKIMSDTDSDVLERFYERYRSSKKRKRNKIKRKKEKQIVFTGKITRKKLTESEESSESQNEHTERKRKFAVGENSFIENSNCQFPSKTFQRIISYSDSDKSVSEACIYDSCTINRDSCSSSDDENTLITKSANKKNVNCVQDLNNSVRLDICPSESSSVATFTLFKHKDASSDDLLKANCKIPCSVLIKRDPLLERKALSLQNDNSSVTNMETTSDLDDDCIIVSESLNNSLSRESVVRLKSPPASEIASVENVICTSNSGPQTETNSLPYNKQSAEIICCDKDVSQHSDLEKRPENNLNTSETKGLDQDNCFMDNEELTAATESESFNVHIVSVKSLNEPDIIVLSDDNEEKDMETAPITNIANKINEDDSDVEICLISSIVSKRNDVNKKVQDVSNSGTHKVHSSSVSVKPSVFNEDCLILDDVDTPSGSCPKLDSKMQQHSQINAKKVEATSNEKNSNDKESVKISNNTLNKDNSSILKILDKIDFNCINKVLNETSSIDTRVSEKSSVVQNSLSHNIESFNKTIDSFPEKLKLKDICVSQQQASIDATFISDGSKMSKISSLNTSNTGEQTIKNVSKNIPNHAILDNIPSDKNCDKSPKFSDSNTNLSASISSGSEKKTIVLNHKTEVNSQNLQCLPLHTKTEYSENALDVLDVLSAKSINNLDYKQKRSVRPLIELYQEEYKKLIEIKCTEKNVSAGLKLLEETQAKKLMHISSSIKNLAKNDKCFHKVKNEFLKNKNINKSSNLKTNEPSDDVQILEYVKEPLEDSVTDKTKQNKVAIFTPSVVEGATEVLRSQSVVPSSSKEVYKHLINSVCAECGEYATSACSGCHKVLYCSVKCGMSSWNKGHSAVCRK